MKESAPFTYVGFLPDFDKLLEKVSVFTDEIWNEYKERKITGGAAAYSTDTIPLLYTPYSTSPNETIKHKYYEYLKPEIERTCIFVSNLTGHVQEKQSMLTRLLPSESIKPHKDTGSITRKTHRVHVPITTNNMCKFTVGETTLNLKPGDIWIIDNSDRYHGVENLGESSRIHLIIDMA
jgi:hypothetical protein